MQYPPTEFAFAPPNGAARAYGAVIRRTESPRAIEHRLFALITAELQAAAAPDAHFTARITAAHRNRELWQTLALDLAEPGNALPDDLRARLISLAIWVGRETQLVIRHGATMQNLIDVNRSIMQGLRPVGQGDA
jgi:flagellar protein FlaF